MTRHIITLSSLIACAVAFAAPVKSMLGAVEVSDDESLPYDAEISYLSADTAGPKIETGILASDDIAISGATWNISSSTVVGWSDKFQVMGNTTLRWNNVDVVKYVAWRVKYTFVFGPQLYIQDEYLGERDTSSTPALPVYLFGRSSAAGTYKGRIYWLKIEQGGVLVRDFIPVRVGTTGYMYDRVSGELFGNMGTGSFTLGPDL